MTFRAIQQQAIDRIITGGHVMSERYPASWVRVVLRVSPSGEMHAVGGDRDDEEGDCPYPGLDRINSRIATLEAENANLREQLRKVVAEEREACAKIADSHNDGSMPDTSPYDRGWSRGAMRIADAIRQRGNEATP